jgi:hypothetical protein
MQSRATDGLLHDACIRDLSIQFVDIVHTDAAHERTVVGHQIGKPEELQPKRSALDDQPTIVTVGRHEPESAVEGERGIEVTRRQVRYSVIGHSVPPYDLSMNFAAALPVTGQLPR